VSRDRSRDERREQGERGNGDRSGTNDIPFYEPNVPNGVSWTFGSDPETVDPSICV